MCGKLYSYFSKRMTWHLIIGYIRGGKKHGFYAMTRSNLHSKLTSIEAGRIENSQRGTLIYYFWLIGLIKCARAFLCFVEK